MPTGTCNLEEFAVRLAQASGAGKGDASTVGHSLSQREINLLAEKIAKEEGLWFPLSQISSLGLPMPSGVENDVYLDGERRVVVKINNLMTSHDVLSLLHRLSLHNSLFPQTGYELEGFTGFGNGSIYPVLSQPFIPDATFATHGEILDYMEALGFRQIGEACFQNGNLIIKDLHPRNVLKRPSGMIYVVDADFEEIKNPEK